MVANQPVVNRDSLHSSECIYIARYCQKPLMCWMHEYHVHKYVL